jgi:hypothetical protein
MRYHDNLYGISATTLCTMTWEEYRLAVVLIGCKNIGGKKLAMAAGEAKLGMTAMAMQVRSEVMMTAAMQAMSVVQGILIVQAMMAEMET